MSGTSPAAVLETALYVHDLQEAEAFYTTVLGLELDSKVEGRHLFFRCGSGMLLVFDPRTTSQPGPVPAHGATGPGHVAFSVPEAELERWADHLSRSDVPVEADIDWPRGGRSLYFRDPEGNSLELAPPGIWGLT